MNRAQKTRSRLIELMYVMLTVMVALSIHDIPSKDYLTINENIEKNIEILFGKHSQLVEKIKQKNIDKDEKYIKIISKIFDLYDDEKKILEKINVLKAKIIIESGGYDKNGKIKNINNKSSVKKIMIESVEKDPLNELISGINEKIKLFCKELEINNNMEFPEIDFNKSSLISTLVYFSKIQNDIVTISDYIFDKLFAQLKFEQPIFDKYELIIIPKSNVVIAGKDFEADVFLNVKIEKTKPEIKVNNEKIIIKDNVGKIKFKTSKFLNFDKDGKFRQFLDISFSQKNPATDKNIEIKKQISFTIIQKQHIEGETIANKSLYKFCKNKYVIKNNDPGEKNNLKITCEGGKVIEKTKTQLKNELIIIPSKKECSLHVYEGNNEVFSQLFNVQEAPMPQVNVIINGKFFNDGAIFDSSSLKNIYINITPNSDFLSLFPEDAFYKIKKWNILYCKNKKIIEKKNIEKEEYSFKEDKALLKQCDKMIIQIEKICRVNFEKEEFDILEDGSLISRSYNIFTKEENEE